MLADRIPKALGFHEVQEIRRFESRDLAKRLGVIPPEGLVIEGFPSSNPHTVFNPSMLPNGEVIEVLGRIIMGYYKYVSAIVSIKVPLDVILAGDFEGQRLKAIPILLPSTRYDFWGVEDPRAYLLSGRKTVTYTGRTISYFASGRPDKRIMRDIPITAYKVNGEWKKAIVHLPPEPLKDYVEGDKNSFLVCVDGSLLFFHRPSLISGERFLLVSKIDKSPIELGEDLKEVRSKDPIEVLRESKFEEKIGWGPPPINIKGKDYLFLLHGVDRELTVYRLFAALIELRDQEIVIKAVTPTYIMEPKEKYEIFGDRPYTIYPCGLLRISKNELLISYGAGDYAMGFALMDLNEVLGELDKGRIY
jgi:predicted GH43/DUF377 family glycosyl hydrolase